MKRWCVAGVVGMGISIWSVGLFGYQKFCYANHAYSVKPERYRVGFERYMDNTTPFGQKKNPHYKYSCDDKGMCCYVHLTHRDKKRIKERLAIYKPQDLVTDQMVQLFLKEHRLKERIVGWVLQDFARLNPEVTVGQIFSAIGLDKV